MTTISITMTTTPDPDVAAFLDTHEAATIFHSQAWAAVLSRSYGHLTRFFVARRGSTIAGVFVVVCQRMWPMGEKWVALPYQFHGGMPVTDDPSIAAVLIQTAVQAARDAGARYLEVRDTLSGEKPEAGDLVPVESGLQVTDIDLRTYDPARIRYTTRAEVRYAAEKGVIVEHVAPDEGFRAFLPPYLRDMRDLGTPQAGLRFFEALVKEMPEHVHIAVARLAGDIIGSLLVLGDRRTAFLRGTTGTRTQRGREHFVGKALTYAAIAAARDRGVSRFHFGITWEKDAGLSAYKSAWRGVTQPVRLYVAPLRGAPPSPGDYFGGFQLARTIWKRLPLAIAGPVGHRVTQWIG